MCEIDKILAQWQQEQRAFVGHPVIHKKLILGEKKQRQKSSAIPLAKLLPLPPLGPSCLVLHVHKRDKLTSYYIMYMEEETPRHRHKYSYPSDHGLKGSKVWPRERVAPNQGCTILKFYKHQDFPFASTPLTPEHVHVIPEWKLDRKPVFVTQGRWLSQSVLE